MSAVDPSPRVTVVIADDSPVMRELLAAVIGEDPGLSVVGVARNGREAVELTLEKRPDVVLMDVHMPEMDGDRATEQIMKQAPTPVVMISASLATREVQLSFEALRAGALTLLAKPLGRPGPEFDAAAREICRTLRLMAEVRVVGRANRGLAVHRRIDPPVGQDPRVAAVAIASSTGGPKVLASMLRDLAAAPPPVLLIAQHIAEGFAEGFASWLSATVGLPIAVARDGETIGPGISRIAPDDRHLVVGADRTLRLLPASPADRIVPSGDRLLASVADAWGARALGVVLTGMGSDGAEGLLAIRRRGGLTAAQSEATCVVYGMPRKAVELGAAEHVLPPAGIASLIRKATGTGRIGDSEGGHCGGA